MIAFSLFVASTTALPALSSAAATDASQQYVRAAKNGEFLSDYYPEGALKRGEQGMVSFRISVEPEGWIGLCEVTGSSGYKALDRETCEIMVQYAKVKPVVNADGKRVRAISDGYITWRLPAKATKLAAAPSRAARKPDPIICRRDAQAGSLVAKTIQCLTRTEWELQQNFTKDAFQELQGKGHSGGGGG